MVEKRPLLSVVVPIYFEEETIIEFYRRTKHVMTGLEPKLGHELIFVNDGSTDRSIELLLNLSQQDAAVRVLDFSRNFGHQLAITAGIDHASGDVVVVIDGDLQDPPEVIPEMVAKWEEGYKVVYGIRNSRKGENILKLFTAGLFYRILNKLSDLKLPRDTGDFRLMDRDVVNALCAIREENRYIRGLVSWIGFSQYGLVYERDARYAGTTKFNFSRMIKFAFDGITGFSDKPLRFSTRIGMWITVTAFIFTIWLIIGKLITPDSTVPGWTSLLVVVLFLGGIQLLSIGALGEYIGRIYRETKRRPLYIVANKYGFDCPDRLTDARNENGFNING